MNFTETQRGKDFLNTIQAAYTADTTQPKIASTHLPNIDTFIKQRRGEIETLFKAQGKVGSESPKAFLSEWATYHCLRSTLSAEGLLVALAKPELEIGLEGQRSGIDVIISEKTDYGDQLPLLGINVKLQSIKPKQRTERQRYDPAINSPSINLSLGDWLITTKENEEKSIRNWISDFAVPNIEMKKTNGKIPYFHHFRKYVFGRIGDTLDNYTWKTAAHIRGEYPPNEHEERLFPKTQDEIRLLHAKLQLTQRIFSDVKKRI